MTALPRKSDLLPDLEPPEERYDRLARMLEAEDYGKPISVGKYTAVLFLALLVFSFGMGAAYVADTVWTKVNAAKLEQNAP